MSFFLHHAFWLYLFVAILSLCVGAFLNVVIFRMPRSIQQEWLNECKILLYPEQSIIDEEKINTGNHGSSCPCCGEQIKWQKNISIVGWLSLKGQNRCDVCRYPISSGFPVIEFLTLFLSLAVVFVYGASLQTVFALIFTWFLIALTFIDFDTQILPDRLTFTLLGLGLLVNSVNLFALPTHSIWGAILGFLSLWIVYFLFKAVTGKIGMGHGDFKLLAALGAWNGVSYILLIIILSAVLGAIFGLIQTRITKENKPFPFGPYLALAGWISLLWGEPIIAWYLGLFL